MNPREIETRLMDFESRLQKAIERGHQAKASAEHERQQAEMTEEECKSLHSRCRLQLSEHIEQCLKQVADHFPAFDFSTVTSIDGWGARISREDIEGGAGRALTRRHSRLEMLIKPYTPTRILEMSARGTIRNKEVVSRNHFQFLAAVDLDGFRELIDQWILEYVEKFSAVE
jgi:hypothetical protein